FWKRNLGKYKIFIMSSGIRFHRVATSCGYSTLTFIRLLPAVLIPAYFVYLEKSGLEKKLRHVEC
ncbi:hypothetical protein, partial [Dubosiella newyorkensis]|uniref:hypothetical protein n=1 Tax=Dubosiella newyorkensis TaxID=1862672 RepID=UPI00272A02E2